MTRLVLITFLTLSSLPAYAAWVEVSGYPEPGHRVYVDPESIRRRGDIAEMWALYDSETAQPAVGKSYLSRKVQTEYNCTQYMKRMLSVIEYSGNMGSGDVVYKNSAFFSAAKWMPAHSGLGETLLNIACGKK